MVKLSKKSTLILSIVVLLNIIFDSLIPLHPDEAYYWTWTKHVDFSYFDHPPMVSWMMKLFTLPYTSELFIRLSTVFCMTLSCIIIYKMAEDMFDRRVADYSLIVFLLFPIVQLGFLVMTPDSPLILFWTLSMYLFYNGVHKDRRYFYLFGISAGLMLDSKYTGVVLFPALFLYLISSKARRKLLISKELLISPILGIIFFAPVLYWNYKHEFISFLFQFSHGIAEKKVVIMYSFINYIGGQLLIGNPVFVITVICFIVFNIVKFVKNDKFLFLILPFIITILFFGYNSLYKESGPNWSAPAYISVTILLGYFFSRRFKIIFVIGIILSFFTVFYVKFPEYLPFKPGAIPKSEFMGYNVIFKEMKPLLTKKNMIISGDSYQNASLGWFYMNLDRVDIITNARFSSYDYWLKEIDKKKYNGAYYFTTNKEMQTELVTMFNSVRLIKSINYHTNIYDKTYYLFECESFK